MVYSTTLTYAWLASDESQFARHALELEKGTLDVEGFSRVEAQVLARNLSTVSE